MEMFITRWKFWIFFTVFFCTNKVVDSNRFSAEPTVLNGV